MSKEPRMLGRPVPAVLSCLLFLTPPAYAAPDRAMGSVANAPTSFVVIDHDTSRTAIAATFSADRLSKFPEQHSSGLTSRFTISRELARYRALVVATEIRHGLPKGLLDALVTVESGYSATAVSARGAMGLAQLMPATAQSLGVSSPFDPLSNVDAGGRYLRGLLRRFGSIALALAAYNAGPRAVDRAGGLPPFRETRRYVARILALWSAIQSSGPGSRAPPTAHVASEPDFGVRERSWQSRSTERLIGEPDTGSKRARGSECLRQDRLERCQDRRINMLGNPAELMTIGVDDQKSFVCSGRRGDPEAASKRGQIRVERGGEGVIEFAGVGHQVSPPERSQPAMLPQGRHRRWNRVFET